MTIGSDQLDEWGKTLTDCDYLYRELQLLIRINPEAYSVDSDAIAAVGVANEHGREDGDMLHPIVFAKTWAWHLAAAARAIPPITSAWVPLIRYVTAHLQYLGRDDRDAFADDLRRVRGMLGALVNEHRMAQGEADDRQALNARTAREELRGRVTQINQPLSRADLHIIWPELTERHWQQLRDRKKADPSPPGHGLYKPSWVSELVSFGGPDLILGRYAHSEYVDVYNLSGEHRVSFEALKGALLAER